MKRLIIPLLASAAIIVGVAVARSPAEAPVSTSITNGADGVLAFSIPSALMVRVDDQYIVPAVGASVFAQRKDGKLTELALQFAIDRAETLKLRPPNFDMEVDAYTLLSMSPDLPVYVSALARQELLDRVGERLAQGAALEELAAEPDFTGFSMLFNLENYTFKGLTQEGGAK